jgi:lipoprotein signal peptidase
MLSFRDVFLSARRHLPLSRITSADPAVPTGQQDRSRQSTAVLVLIGMVVVLDQTAKWWAWRHVSRTMINSGGDILVGHTIGAWYASPVTGAVLDLLDFALLSIAVSVLARWRASVAVRVPGALITGGWGSNLLDRLGFHYWTAPGSVRGVVDFIHIDGHYYNIADFFIISCTPLFLLAAGYEGVRAAGRPTAAGAAPRPARSQARVRMQILAVAGAGLTLVVALGAANYGGVNASPAHKITDGHPAPGVTPPCPSADSPVSAARAHYAACHWPGSHDGGGVHDSGGIVGK